MKKILYILALGFLVAPGASSAYTLSFKNTLPKKAHILAQFDNCNGFETQTIVVPLEAQESGSMENEFNRDNDEPCKLKYVYAEVITEENGTEEEGMETRTDSRGWAAPTGGFTGDASWTLSESQLECKDIDGKKYCMYVLEKDL